jgi:hypothetical protein
MFFADLGRGEQAYFVAEIMHTSYWISLLMALSMIFSFRFKPLNVIALGILPSVFVTIFEHDIPLLMNPDNTPWGSFPMFGLFWWCVLTTHIPIPFIAAYLVITRKETLSKPAFLLNIPVIMGWFFFLDDKENGTAISGDTYILAAFALLIIWGAFYLFIICWDVKNVDPLVAKVVHLKGIEWSSKSKAKEQKMSASGN